MKIIINQLLIHHQTSHSVEASHLVKCWISIQLHLPKSSKMIIIWSVWHRDLTCMTWKILSLINIWVQRHRHTENKWPLSSSVCEIVTADPEIGRLKIILLGLLGIHLMHSLHKQKQVKHRKLKLSNNQAIWISHQNILVIINSSSLVLRDHQVAKVNNIQIVWFNSNKCLLKIN